MTATKLPGDTRPLIQDPDLAREVEAMLAPHNGKQLEKAQAACRKVHGSNTLGAFSEIREAYRAAIERAVEKERGAD
jgi:hypothetical protein